MQLLIRFYTWLFWWRRERARRRNLAAAKQALSKCRIKIVSTKVWLNEADAMLDEECVDIVIHQFLTPRGMGVSIASHVSCSEELASALAEHFSKAGSTKGGHPLFITYKSAHDARNQIWDISRS